MNSIPESPADLSPSQRKLFIQRIMKEAARQANLDSQLLPIVSVSRDRGLPLSFAQQRLWFLYLLNPHSSAYNMPVGYRLTGHLNQAALQQSLDEIVRRHEVLRTTFISLDGQPIQVVSTTIHLVLPIVDLQELSEAEREIEIQQQFIREAHSPFDLTRGPLLRATLLRLDAMQHVLLLTMHHIVSDGWSLAVFDRELMVLYESFSAGNLSPLPELPIQYVDFASWQMDQMKGEGLEAQLAYWKQQLGGQLHVLELPTDYPRKPIETLRGAKQSLALSNDLTKTLKALSQQEECTLFMTLLAAFKVLMYRYTRQEDIALGVPIAGRSRREVEGLIGFFVNTLVLRTDLSGTPSFRELLMRVREVTLGAYAHQELPFEKLVEELQPERDPNRNPLFDIMFNFVNTPPRLLELAEVKVTYQELPELESKFSMTLYVRERGNEIDLELVYRHDLFSAEHMALLLNQFRYLLEQIVTASERSILDYSLVTQESRHLLPDPRVALPEPLYRPVYSMFTSWLDSAAECPAIRQGNCTWTYNDLAKNMHRVARDLRAQGLGSGDVVAVSGPRSFGLIASMLGVLRSGGVLLTLDRNLPSRRQQIMIKEAQAKYLLYVGDWQAEDEWLRESFSLVVISVDPGAGYVAEPEKIASLNMMHLPEVAPDDAAYLFFTSGTTGIPKGVLGCHKGLSHFLNWQRERFAIQPQDRCAQLTALSFDVVLRDIFLPLVSGATLCLPEESDDLGGGRSLSWLERERISVVHTVPTLAQTWLMDIPSDVSLCNLRWVFFAGEPLPEALVRRWREIFPKSGGVVNLYGPTETTLAKCFYIVPSDTLPGIQPVGWPLPETQAIVLTEGDHMCGIGESGEIVLRTPFRSLGYINSQDEDQKRFFKNPFRDDERDLLYHTGDHGRYRPDGSLEILGRLDDQVKVRGVRVEPNEIVALLSQHPAVKSCVVVSRKNEEGNIYLVAYVVKSKRVRVTTDMLRLYLNKCLPPAMIPSAFVMLDALPLTPNGKVDRHALPSPEIIQPKLERDFAAPRTKTEEALVRIWTEVLKIERIGIHDNFFEVGGDSLRSLQVFAKARQAGIQFAPRHLLQHQTIAELATVASTASPILAEQGLVAGSVPLLPGQCWMLEMDLVEYHHWNSSQLLEARQRLDASLLEKVVQNLLVHHDALRLRFVREGSSWRQFIVAPDGYVPFTLLDLSVLSEAEQVSEIEATAERLHTSLNLSEGPILRIALFDLGVQKPQRLLIIIHHLAIDSISWDILLEDLEKAYQQTSHGEAMQLPPKTTSIQQWGERLTLYARSSAVRQELPYWLAEHWQQAPRLPMDYPEGRAEDTVGTERALWVSLGVKDTQTLQEVARAYNVQIIDMLLTALVQSFKSWTGKCMLSVHMAYHGREKIFEDVDLSRTIGYLTTGYSVLLDLGKDNTVGDALKSTQEQLRNVPNRGFNYGLLRYGEVEIVEKMRALEPEVAFNYVGQYATESLFFGKAKESKGHALTPCAKRFYLIYLDLGISDGELRVRWEYGEKIYKRATIACLAQEFIRVLRSLITLG